MSKLIFLDLETTGLEDRDKICELALIIEENKKYISSSQLCKTSKKISSSAMSVHHITNEMIKDMDICENSTTYKLLNENNIYENIVISHNARFDLEMLEKEGFTNKMQVVDTLRCVKSLIPECEEFSLQFLRYELDLYKEEKQIAQDLQINLQSHRALSDTLHLSLLYKNLTQYATLSQLIEISSKPVLLEKLPFGKYKGRYIEDILHVDSSYIHWLLNNIEDDEDLNYSLEFYRSNL